jgi:hypothetical protein
LARTHHRQTEAASQIRPSIHISSFAVSLLHTLLPSPIIAVP